MKLIYWQGPCRNFGDDLNLWIWDFLLPGWEAWDQERYLIGVGTILGKRQLPNEVPLLVVGSGVGYGVASELEPSELYDVRCVRGEGSARLLGISEDLGIIDPAVMVSKMPEFQGLEPTGDRIFIPHWASVAHSSNDWGKICKQAGLKFISPSLPAKEVIKSIARSRLVIAESMHAAIIADAFRVPWIAANAHPSFNFFKWKDWADTLGLDVVIHDLYAANEKYFCTSGIDMKQLSSADNAVTTDSNVTAMLRKNRAIAHTFRSFRNAIQSRRAFRNLKRIASMEPNLSDSSRLDARIARFEHVLEGIKADYA